MARDNSIEVLIKVIDDATGQLKKITKEFKNVEEPIKKADKSLKNYFDQFKKIAGVTTGLVLIGSGIRKLIQETSAAEQAQAQLAAALESNGNAAGFTAEQLNAIAQELQRTTTFSDDAVTSAQTLLLAFSNIRGDNFTRTTRAVVDLSTRLGRDLTSTALLVGRALNDPVGSLGALSRSGVQFSKDQEVVIKRLVESGRAAEAQNIILTELERKFGGAGVAGRDKLGGALAALKNQFDDLFESTSQGTEEAVKSINKLTEELAKPETKQAINTITKAIFDLGAALVSATAKAVNFFTNFRRGVLETALESNQRALETLSVAQIERQFGSVQKLRQEIERLQIELGLIDGTAALAQVDTQVNLTPTGGGGRGAPTLDLVTEEKKQAERLAQLQAALDADAANTKRIYDDAIKVIQSLETPLEAINRKVKEQDAALKAVLQTYGLAPEVYKAASDAQIRVIQEAGRQRAELIGTPEDLEPQTKKISELAVFADQAARNIQSSFANFLFNPFEEGLKGMLKGFVDTLRRMVAELVAQQALIAFFRIFTGGTGIVADFANAAVKSLSGERAMGGPVSGGSSYLVGERGPEIFTPGASGMITPNNRLGGGVTVAPVYNIDARGATQDLVKFLPSILEENTRRAVELARRSIYDDLSRGAFGRA